jgi:hypothetical protein
MALFIVLKLAIKSHLFCLKAVSNVEATPSTAFAPMHSSRPEKGVFACFKYGLPLPKCQ